MKLSLLRIINIAMFAAIAAIVSLFGIPVFFIPGFYRLEFSDSIVLACSFWMGPTVGVIIELMKILLKFSIKGSSTLGISELASFINSVSLVWPAATVYKKYKTFRCACISLFFGSCCLLIVSSLMNYFILLPLCENLLNISVENMILFAQNINPIITNEVNFILFAVCPFNLLKSALVCFFAMAIHKRCHNFI